MSVLWASSAAAEATGGRNTQDWQATGVSIDTRTLQPGDLFVALKDQRDGHDFVAQALSNGASAALVSQVPAGVGEDAPLLIVPDVLEALEALGHAARARFQGKVVGVTGSVGKTSTKEMLRVVLGPQGRVHAAEASYNNHWGVPLTLARMPEGADFAIIEIGMNHPGEISPLSRLAQPHVAMITTIAPAHMEAFENIEGIAREKAAIFDGVVTGGVAVTNGDVDTAPILSDHARACGLKIVTFGADAGVDYRLKTVTINDDTTSVRAELPGGEVLFRVNSAGRHFATNALGVLAVVEALGADVAVAARDMIGWRPPAGRGTREKVYLDAVDFDLSLELIDDAFNANPTSMAAALEVLAKSRPRNGIGRVGRGRKIAILGDMLELGADEREVHAGIAGLSYVDGIDLIHCVGPRMEALWDALPELKKGEWAEDADTLAGYAHRLIDAGDVILVKGSKGSYVSRVVDAIRNLGHPAPDED